VLPIGGVKEKTLAAKRSKVEVICFPVGNERDWRELDEKLREGLEPVFAEHYVDLLPVLFPSLREQFKKPLKALEEASKGLR
jgi:ATP-dependent Lon protease